MSPEEANVLTIAERLQLIIDKERRDAFWRGSLTAMLVWTVLEGAYQLGRHFA